MLNLPVWFAPLVVFRAIAPLRWAARAGVGEFEPQAFLVAPAALVAVLRFHVGMLPTLAASAPSGAITRWIDASS